MDKVLASAIAHDQDVAACITAEIRRQAKGWPFRMATFGIDTRQQYAIIRPSGDGIHYSAINAIVGRGVTLITLAPVELDAAVLAAVQYGHVGTPKLY